VGVEHEIKISVPAEFVLPDLEGAGGLHAVDRGVHVLDTTYWDTDSLQLLNSHQGLRYRTTDGQGGIWTVKAKTRRDGLALVREETEFEGAANRPPEAAIRELGAVVDPSALHPVARLRAERHVVDLVDSGEEWAELADDRVAVLDGAREADRFREVELELRERDDGERARAVVARLRAAGGGEPEATSKYVRALRALGHAVPDGSD